MRKGFAVDQNSFCALDATDGRLSRALTAIDVIEQSSVKFRLSRQHNEYGYSYWSLRAVQPRDYNGRQKTLQMYVGNPPETILEMIKAKLNQRRLKLQGKSKLIQNENHIKRLKHYRVVAKQLTENIARQSGFYFRGYRLIKKEMV